MKHYLSHIQKARPAIERLEVHSFETNIYLVRLQINGQFGYVYSQTDNIQRFYNAQHIRESFADCHITESVMIHDSAYDEMIGNPDKASDRLPLPFSMTQPY